MLNATNPDLSMEGEKLLLMTFKLLGIGFQEDIVQTDP